MSEKDRSILSVPLWFKNATFVIVYEMEADSKEKDQGVNVEISLAI